MDMDLLEKLKENPKNPRNITSKNFEKLKKSIKGFPLMLTARPIVYDENFIVLGGNMRLRALRALAGGGFEIKEEYFKSFENLTELQKQEFIIRDNVSDGTWDNDILANEWSDLPLAEWGIELGWLNDDFYIKNIKVPIYEPAESKPDIKELVDKDKVLALIEEINSSSLDEEIKEFLRIAAGRHFVFDYSKIADYYANSSEETKKLMEKSALVIIDYDKAVENGYVRLVENIMRIQGEDYSE